MKEYRPGDGDLVVLRVFKSRAPQTRMEGETPKPLQFGNRESSLLFTALAAAYRW
jgi:hypothetical protein